jgi:hypothetical protein
MTQKLRPVLAWIGLLVLAFVNGALRELVLKPLLHLDTALAHQLSCLTGVGLWLGFVYMIWDKLKVRSSKQAALIGASWLLATFIFETFVLNRNMSREEILQTYNVADGELWGLALLTIGLMPSAFFRWKRDCSAQVLQSRK